MDFTHAQYDINHAIAMATTSMPETDAGSEQLLCSLPRAKSRVWQYFGFCEENGEIVDTKKVTCRLCKRTLSTMEIQQI